MDDTDYKIAYVIQETRKPGDVEEFYTTVGTHTISFKVDTINGVQVGENNPLIILLGGDGVDAPASAIYPKPPVEVKLMDGDTKVTALATAIDVNLDSTTIEEAVKAALASYTLYVDGVAADWNDVAVTVDKNAEGEYAYKATLTVAEGAAYVDFNADLSWTADALAISNTSYNVAAADVAGEDSVASLDEIIAAVKAKVVAETIKVTKTTPALEAVIADAADAITVVLKTDGFDGTAANDAVEFEVTLAADTYGEAIVAGDGLTATVTVKYTLESAPDVEYGNVNGDDSVDMADAILIWQFELGKTSLTAEQQIAANVNGDDSIDMADAILIWQYELGKISSFPVEQ